MSFYVVIPARYQSSRLPGKPLLMLAGKPMLQHVYERAKATAAHAVIIATDDTRIEMAAQRFGADVCMTAVGHASGTQRISEVIVKRRIPAEAVVVNLQGDEPLMPARCVDQVAGLLLQHRDAQIATLSAPITDATQLANPNIVKVVCDKQGYALYFSRAAIPYQRDKLPQQLADALATGVYQRHIGIYAYRAGYVHDYVNQTPSPHEQLENLEQLRVMWHGGKIVVAAAAEVPGPGVDTAEELHLVDSMLQQRNN